MLKKIIALFAALIASLSVIPVEAADCSAAAYAVVDVQTGEMLASKKRKPKAQYCLHHKDYDGAYRLRKRQS